MKISIISYAFYGLQKAGVMDIFGYLESCRYRYGLDAADIWNGTLASLDEDYLHRVREALDERELTLACFAVDGAHIWEDDPDRRDVGTDDRGGRGVRRPPRTGARRDDRRAYRHYQGKRDRDDGRGFYRKRQGCPGRCRPRMGPAPRGRGGCRRREPRGGVGRPGTLLIPVPATLEGFGRHARDGGYRFPRLCPDQAQRLPVRCRSGHQTVDRGGRR